MQECEQVSLRYAIGLYCRWAVQVGACARITVLNLKR